MYEHIHKKQYVFGMMFLLYFYPFEFRKELTDLLIAFAFDHKK